MAIAAKLAQSHPAVGEQQSQRFNVVMLDEYQDTSHAQRVLLRSLFGGVRPGVSVTAVGDPMQSIYGWRGATAENLAAFVEDFPQEDGSPAPKDQLTTSWRNPQRALELANDVAAKLFSESAGPRPVDELQPRDGAPEGDIELGYFASEREEHEHIAQHLKSLYERYEDPNDFSAAVLVRTNKQSPLIAQALDDAGVPNEIVGLGGLLWQPEIQDLIAVATILVRPPAGHQRRTARAHRAHVRARRKGSAAAIGTSTQPCRRRCSGIRTVALGGRRPSRASRRPTSGAD